MLGQESLATGILPREPAKPERWYLMSSGSATARA